MIKYNFFKNPAAIQSGHLIKFYYPKLT